MIMIKRVVGLPGDYVRSRTDKQQLVPKGHCWVEGDNPNNTIDSNNFGPIPMGLIQAKVSYVVFPPARAGKLEIKEPSALKVSDHRDPTNYNLKMRNELLEKKNVLRPDVDGMSIMVEQDLDGSILHEDRIVDLDEALYSVDLYGDPSPSTSELDSLADSVKEHDKNTDNPSKKSRRPPS